MTTWKTKSGEILKIAGMSRGHIENCLAPVRLGEHPTRYYNWKMHFDGQWTKREEEIAHAAYLAGWYHRCNQDPDSMGG